MPTNSSSYNNRFTNSRLWVENHRLSLEIFKVTKVFTEDYKGSLGLTINQEAITISSNITLSLLDESQTNPKDSYLGFAKKRLLILENLLILGKDSGNIGESVYSNLIDILNGVKSLLDQNLRN